VANFKFHGQQILKLKALKDVAINFPFKITLLSILRASHAAQQIRQFFDEVPTSTSGVGMYLHAVPLLKVGRRAR
jgi:hypothetical protein